LKRLSATADATPALNRQRRYSDSKIGCRGDTSSGDFGRISELDASKYLLVHILALPNHQRNRKQKTDL
jgi:hypothetical protein